MQSTLKLHGDGIDFLPANPAELMTDSTAISSFLSCYNQCNLNPLCRTFVSDITIPFVCRLYQGSIETGAVIASSSSTSRVAGIIYDASLYTAYNQICDSKMPPLDRYLVCINQLWVCPITTFWNGSMCLNQVYYQDPCNINQACRQDVGLQCSSSCDKCICNSTAIWNSTSCVQSICPSLTPLDSTLTGRWPLDGDAHDLFNRLNGTLIKNASFVTGYIDQAIDCSNSAFVQLSYINFYLRSFTVEFWFYRTAGNNQDMILFGECASQTTGQCLHYGIKYGTTPFMGFYNNDVYGSTITVNNQWYHIAFVYDYAARQHFIYLNGLLETMNNEYSNNDPYLGQSGDVTICKGDLWTFFYGYIDQVSITCRAKAANEILDDATLVAYYSFDCGSTLDSGPNLLHGNASGQITIAGRINDALLFNLPNAYFQAYGFLIFGIGNQSFSISLWIAPLNLSGTLFHVSNQSTGDGWCMSLLGFNSSGSLIAQMSSASVAERVLKVNVWTHVVQTFSVANGTRLYINGTLRQSNFATTFFSPPYQPMYIIIASRRFGGPTCMSGSIDPGSYTGAIDELRIYNREITATEIYMLSS